MKNEGQPQPITERTFDFAGRVVKLCVHLDQKRGSTRVLGPQILRAEQASERILKKLRARRAKLTLSAK